MSSRTTLNDQMRRLDVESIASFSFNTYAGDCLLHTEKEKVAPPRRKSDTVRYGVSKMLSTTYSRVVQVFLDHRYYD